MQLDDSSDRMNAKVRKAQLQKIPYMLIVGDREAEAGTVSVRLRTEEKAGDVPLEDFVRRAREAVEDRRLI